MGEKMNACRILVKKLEGQRPLEKLKGKWEDNIKIDLKR
jgi:hypothetical protein